MWVCTTFSYYLRSSDAILTGADILSARTLTLCVRSVKITSEALLQGLLSSIIKICDFLRKDLYRAQLQRKIISPEVNQLYGRPYTI